VWTSPADGVHSINLSLGQSATFNFGSRQRQLRVTGRHVFYNNSAFDGRDPAAGATDDTAIATEKSLIGSTPATTSGILTGYAGGINGIMVDVDELLAAPTLADFSFKVPDPANPFAWLDAPAPAGFAVRPIEPSDPTRRRVTFTWPDNRLRNTWLQVSVLANAATRRIAPDIFYVGNLVGETVVVTPTRVTAADLSATRAAISRARASVNSPFDHNRDGWVNVRDVEVVRATLGNVLPALVLPQSPAAAALTPQRSAPTRRTSLASDLLAEQKM
jgi:hypothetical protein